MIERGGAVVMRMWENVQQVTIKPLIQATIAPDTLVYTDECDIYSCLEEWGDDHESVCHSAGKMPVMTMATAFVKSMSIPWKASGRC
jgi:transposase